MIEGIFLGALTFGLLAFWSGFFAGRRAEAQDWRRCAIDSMDHMRSDGKDYKVMLLDTFYRDYHNPVVRARMAGVR